MPRGLTTGIIYIPLDVRWPRSKKVRALIVRHAEEGMAAWALYLAMVCYCRENLSDGFVPVEEAGAMAYPLPPDRAGHLLKLLEDYRLIGPADGQGLSDGHSQGSSDGLSTGLSDGLSQGLSQGYIVRAYIKRNGTRAEALELAERLAKAGRAGGLTRRSQWNGSTGQGQGLSQGLSTGVPQTETETETGSRARAGTRPREAGWTPHSALDGQGRRPSRGAPTRQPPPAKTTLADAHRPGGPTQEVHTWAAKARAGITRPDDPATGDRQEPLPEPPEPAEQPAEQEPPEPAPAPEPEEPAEDEIPF
jgi:hypothetical protein